jgi:ribonuclease T
MPNRPKFYICVDVEAAGPNPSNYSLLSIGAATIEEPRQTFYIELQPVNSEHKLEADLIHRLSLDQLSREGVNPAEAMKQFEEWVKEVSGDKEPVFVAFGAPFDWMFVADNFHRYLKRNPFGHRALDMKALFMGLRRIDWGETTYKKASAAFGQPEALTHHALNDATQGAELFAAMLAELKEFEYES